MKARFKTIVLTALGAIATFSAITYTSCNNDKCKAIACAYGGVCKDGACICPTGFEGAQCETITRDKYNGVWHVFEKGTYTTNADFDITIQNGLTMTDMVITNFYNHNLQVDMKITADTVLIPQQVKGNYEIQGHGTLDREAYYAKHGKITMWYTIKDLNTGLIDDFGVHSGTPSQWTR